MKIKTIIVDDERLARLELIKLLSKYNDIEVIAEYGDPEEAIDGISNSDAHLVFLDIQMPGKNGFDVLEELETVPHIIFVTAFDEFAIKAFEVNAMDYVLKPVEEDRLRLAVEKAISIIKEEKIIEEKDAEKGALSGNDQVFLKDGEKCWFVHLKEVRLFESIGNYVRVHFASNKPLILKSLNSLDKRLSEKEFFRANRKHIINLKWIEKIEPWFNGGMMVELKGGEKIEISRRQSAKLRDRMSL
ncbi:MAG: response regulator transcription factor [Flavobacteriales bacterium]|nr:response regulator transcription factor [Flavobacteriales bacterium]